MPFTEYERLKLIPPFDEDDEHAPPPAVLHWRAAIEEADALLFATPEYNHSVPGQLKNAVDWASRPSTAAVLRNKPVAVIGASTGMFGAVWSQAELRKTLAAAGARVVDRELPVAAAHDAFHDDGSLNDDDTGRGAQRDPRAPARNHPTQGRRMTLTASPSDYARGLLAALDAKDVPALAALMTDDVRMRLGNADLIEGKPAFIEAAQGAVASVAEIRHHVLDAWSDGDALIVQLDVHYTRLDGQVLTLPCCNVFRLRDGLVADYRVYMDINPVYA